jgi:hypothetical protein
MAPTYANDGGSGSFDEEMSAIVAACAAILLRPLAVKGKPMNSRPMKGR